MGSEVVVSEYSWHEIFDALILFSLGIAVLPSRGVPVSVLTAAPGAHLSACQAKLMAQPRVTQNIIGSPQFIDQQTWNLSRHRCVLSASAACDPCQQVRRALHPNPLLTRVGSAVA